MRTRRTGLPIGVWMGPDVALLMNWMEENQKKSHPGDWFTYRGVDGGPEVRSSMSARRTSQFPCLGIEAWQHMLHIQNVPGEAIRSSSLQFYILQPCPSIL